MKQEVAGQIQPIRWTTFPRITSINRKMDSTNENSSNHDACKHLEEKISFLERHIEEQDREIYHQAECIQRLTRQMQALQRKLDAMEDTSDMPLDEKPPHY